MREVTLVPRAHVSTPVVAALLVHDGALSALQAVVRRRAAETWAGSDSAAASAPHIAVQTAAKAATPASHHSHPMWGVPAPPGCPSRQPRASRAPGRSAQPSRRPRRRPNAQLPASWPSSPVSGLIAAAALVGRRSRVRALMDHHVPKVAPRRSARAIRAARRPVTPAPRSSGPNSAILRFPRRTLVSASSELLVVSVGL